MKIKAVIFDWAGTTVDYGCFAPVRTFIEVFKEYGIDVTMDETRKPMGMLKWDHIKTMLAMPNIKAQWEKKYGRASQDSDIDGMHNKFTANLLKILDQYCELKPYAREAVETLRATGIRIGSTTGYTDEMMNIVLPKAKDNGYSPDYWITPNSVNNCGRPYPYMIFRNLEAMQIKDVRSVLKVGDTISDIEEAKAAGVLAVGILEGSSLMGLSEEEYKNLNVEEQEALIKKLTREYREAGADFILYNLKELPALVQSIA
ncbi:phosphonoacetaldehyde hydrolase [Amedibacillus sp. YH-ame10]